LTHSTTNPPDLQLLCHSLLPPPPRSSLFPYTTLFRSYLLWYVMPYLPGETLRQALRRESRLSISSAVAIAAEVLDALEHAHAHEIGRAHVKPDNIVLAPPPQGAVLVDLGIARAIATSGDDRVTRSGFVVGTEEYM